jgi:hypothetical protein
MSIGLALFLIAMTYFAITYPEFRKLLFVCVPHSSRGGAIAIATVLVAWSHSDRVTIKKNPARLGISAPQGVVPSRYSPSTQSALLWPYRNTEQILNGIQLDNIYALVTRA